MIRVALALLLVAVTAASAQAKTGPITLLPFNSEGHGIASVAPEGWTDVGRGIFARKCDASDKALIAQQSALVSAHDVLTSLLPQLELSAPPPPVGQYQGAALTWTLYRVNMRLDAEWLAVDLALAEEYGTTYVVLLQAPHDEYAALHDSVFLPTLDAFAPLVVEVGPVPYDVADVTFKNGDHTLAGTLTLPPAPGPHPAIVLVSGSGPRDRDESLPGIPIRPFRLLADALTRAGIAVLRYDDRGVGASTGTFSTATIPDFASDAEAALRYLQTRDEIDPRQIGLLGHSEGGLVAAMLGARHDDFAFIISLAGPGVNGHDVLRLQNQRVMEAEGASQEQIDAQVAFIDKLVTIVDDPEAVETLVYQHTLEQARSLPDAERGRLGNLETYARAVAQQTAQQFNAGWFASFLTYDPVPDWARTTAPVLAIFGGKDVQVDAAQNAPAVAAALLKGGNRDVAIVVLPDAKHLFQQAATGSPTEYATLPADFSPDLLPAIVNWLNRHVGAESRPAGPPVAATPGH